MKLKIAKMKPLWMFIVLVSLLLFPIVFVNSNALGRMNGFNFAYLYILLWGVCVYDLISSEEIARQKKYFMLMSLVLVILHFSRVVHHAPWIGLVEIIIDIVVLWLLSYALSISVYGRRLDTIALFIMLWFFPVSMWFIQPKIRSYLAG